MILPMEWYPLTSSKMNYTEFRPSVAVEVLADGGPNLKISHETLRKWMCMRCD
jgi:hypothetical protein